MNFSDIAILNIEGAGYGFVISDISKSEASRKNLKRKKQSNIKQKNSLSHIKVGKEIGNI